MPELGSHQSIVKIFQEASARPQFPRDQVLQFSRTANPDSIAEIATWARTGTGNAYRRKNYLYDTPFEAFSQELDREFSKLSKSDQEGLLRGSFRMVFGDFPIRGSTQATYLHSYSRYDPVVQRDTITMFRGGVFNADGVTYTKNIAVYLEKVLEMVNGDLEAAKTFLSSVPALKYPYTKTSLGNTFPFLYRSRNLDPAENELGNYLIRQALRTRERFKNSNPQARALAFWADTQLGTFSLDGENADIRLEEVLSENSISLRTEVLRHIKDKLLSDAPGFRAKHALIERAIINQKDLLTALSEERPDNPFIAEYKMVQRLLKLRGLESRLEGGIEPKDLATLLVTYPTLITQISVEELERAIDSTNDPNVIGILTDQLNRRKLLDRAQTTS